MIEKRFKPIKRWIKKFIKIGWKYVPLPYEQKAILEYKYHFFRTIHSLYRDKSEEMRRELISQYERYRDRMGEEAEYPARLAKLKRQYRRITILRPYIMNIGPLCMQYLFIQERKENTPRDEKLLLFNYHDKKPIYRLDDPAVSNQFIMHKMMELIDFVDENNAAFWGYAVLHSNKFIFFEDLYRPHGDINKKEQIYHKGKGQYPSRVYMHFSESEFHKGVATLADMHLTPKKYCCFFSRSNEYHESYFHDHGTKDAQITSKRNSDITDYFQACTELAKSNIKAVRMGALDSRKVVHDNIVDYTNICRSEFMDFFLAGYAKFFLGDASGILFIPWLFNIPVGIVNNISITCRFDIECNYNTEGCMTIFKKWWSRKEERYLTLKEMLPFFCEFGVDNEGEISLLDALGIEFHSNTAEEIADLALEMNMRIDGMWVDDEETMQLRDKYWRMVNTMLQHASPKVILWDLEPGSMFLKKNQWLFD